MYKWLLIFLAFPLAASDMQREARWAAEISDAILTGSPEWLDLPEGRFLGIYTKAEDTAATGAVLLVHGIGVHPDWPEVINPLREQLPARGWATLSVQMPILAVDAKIEDYYPLFPAAMERIGIAVESLAARGHTPVVIVGHSLGSQMAAAWVAQRHKPPVAGFVAIGMTGRKQDGHGSTLDYLAAIDIPVLDIHGEFDLDSVLQSNGARGKASAANPAYQALAIEGAGHMFQGQADPLVDAVARWLDGLRAR